MPKTVFNEIGKTGERRLARAIENEDICTRFYGIVAWCERLAHDRGVDIRGIEIGEVTMQERIITSTITFRPFAVIRNAQHYARCAGFEEYTAKKAADMAYAVGSNPTFLKFLDALTERVDKWADQKGIPFSTVRIPRCFIEKGTYVIVAEVMIE